MKKIALSLSLFIWAAPVYSALITSPVTGADMAGIEVTAYFTGGGSEVLTWATTSTDGSVPYGEGYAGGVVGTGWSLSQQGDTFGDITPANQLLGLWTLTSQTSLVMLEIDVLDGGFVFDNEFSVEYTPGSDVGRPFTSNLDSGPAAVYSQLFSSPDLYGLLTLDWGNTEFTGEMLFMADTDRITVPEPASALLLASGLLGVAGARVRARKQKKAIKNEAQDNA